ncbi:STAS domain-containing protein [Salinispira pacifica]|uniref:Anti-sigma factor antagonist n=1 Tax=Salinispira pacifica TaxID=1307761 RepID=V5WLQ9_9SPIO|nr:STAS domain-containing protein [Salinispira pacifica]AHC16548.1 anti-sigma F factor antagonist, anti sigma b factor antagonist [Salinispira pacifica]
MEVKLKNKNGVLLVELQEEIDLFHANKLKLYFNKIFESSHKKIVLNFQEVTYIDSSGIGALLNIFKESKKREIKILFTNIHGSVKKVIELTKLDDYFPILRTQEEAIEQLEAAE